MYCIVACRFVITLETDILYFLWLFNFGIVFVHWVLKELNGIWRAKRQKQRQRLLRICLVQRMALKNIRIRIYI